MPQYEIKQIHVGQRPLWAKIQSVWSRLVARWKAFSNTDQALWRDLARQVQAMHRTEIEQIVNKRLVELGVLSAIPTKQETEEKG